ncbi:hypothetical protein KP509_14G085800 [Ceratopteris richardii]|uniref:Uncharacterized protein n=1 Tax=Ceratopteris richardii TaxID=49495 RepID=A0A8T2TBM6_CERRI|nr:hypothetical protein KP509_14G085800 [Ceratopteris richardii]
MVSALCRLEVGILMLLLVIQTAFPVRSLLHSQPINSCIQVRGSTPFEVCSPAIDKLHDTKTDAANEIQIHGSLSIQHIPKRGSFRIYLPLQALRSTPPPGSTPVSH